MKHPLSLRLLAKLDLIVVALDILPVEKLIRVDGGIELLTRCEANQQKN
jgi:hypothetical protein